MRNLVPRPEAPSPAYRPAYRRRRGSRILPFLFLLPGLPMLYLGAQSLRQSEQLLRQSASAQGTVIDYSHGSKVWYPVVRFAAQDGQSYQFKSSWGSMPPDYQLGDTVEVLYPPSDPQRAMIRDFFPLWETGLTAGGIGLIFSSIGALGLYAILWLPYRRRRRR